MRKSIIVADSLDVHSQLDQKELDILHNARVEITSEHPDFPIEAAFSAHGLGWRASASCPQRIRIIFDEPRPVHRIHLRFVETEVERTQEFTLRWASGAGSEWHEIVRQQWTFAPHGSNLEIEDYKVDLNGVRMLELSLRADLSERAVASLARLRVA